LRLKHLECVHFIESEELGVSVLIYRPVAASTTKAGDANPFGYMLT